MTALQQDMESFLPSEIARLVYGYLEEEECADAAQAFLESSLQLKECLTVAKRGRKFNTKIYGLSLVDFFDLLSEAISFLKENSKTLKETCNRDSRLFGILHADDGNSDLVHKENNTEKNKEITEATNSECIDLDSQYSKTVNHSKSINNKNDSSRKTNDLRNKEAPAILNSNQSSQKNEKDCFSSHFIKIKEENDSDEYGLEVEENHEEEDVISSIEPEVQILSSPVLQQRQDTTSTVNVITDPLMFGRSPQILCQPYSMVHMVPAYPATANPSLSTALFMPQQNTSLQQQPITVHHSQAIIQATGSSSNTLSTMWPKPKVSSGSQNQQGSALKSLKRSSNYANPQMGNKDNKLCKLKQNIYQRSSKLRPIAPKITQSLDNGVKVQVVHTKENPLIDTSPAITKRCLRSRRKSSHKSEQAATPFFIDMQEICNDN